MKSTTTKTPPHSIFVPVVHNIQQFYTLIYQIGNTLSKRDKLGIHCRIENETLNALNLALKASFLPKYKKLAPLEEARISIEILKYLIRVECEIKIISEKIYIDLETLLQEISKMINGWMKYLTQNPA